MAVRYEYIYTVVGNGSFPIDMLRYDAARPAGESDSNLIERTLNHIQRPTELRIEIRGDREPTVARWKSFGWRVITDSLQKRKVT